MSFTTSLFLRFVLCTGNGRVLCNQVPDSVCEYYIFAVVSLNTVNRIMNEDWVPIPFTVTLFLGPGERILTVIILIIRCMVGGRTTRRLFCVLLTLDGVAYGHRGIRVVRGKIKGKGIRRNSDYNCIGTFTY